MIQFLLFIALITEVIIFAYYDKKVYGNYLSPVTIFSFPLIFILIILGLYGEMLEFKPLHTDVLLLNIIGIAILWTGSLFWSVIIPQKQLQKAALIFTKPSPQIFFPFKNFVLILSWIVIIIMTFSFSLTFSKFGAAEAIGTDEFVYEYSGYGFTGHILVLGILAVIYLIGMVKKNDTFSILTLLILIALLLLQQVKTWLYVPVAGGIILRLYNARRIRLKPSYIILFITAVIILFFLSYYFAFFHSKENILERTIMMFKHMTGYLFSGILGFGEHINEKLPIGGHASNLIMPFKNLWNYITGNNIKGVVSNYHVFIDKNDLVDVNVKTFFGTILINAGVLWSFIYIFFLSILLYFNWIMAGLTRNYWLTILYAFIASPLVIGWFDFCYNLLTFVELPVIIILITIISRYVIKRKTVRSL